MRFPDLTPSERRLCTLLQAGSPAGEVPHEWQEALVEVATTHRLDLVVAAGARREAWVPAVRDELLTRLRAAALLEEVRRRELAGVLTALHEAGAPGVVFKGGALAYQIYARPELRPRGDTDVLIETRNLRLARDVLTARGYEQPHEVSGSLVTTQCHFARSDRSGVGHALDIHWKPFIAPRFADILTVGEIAASAEPLPALGPHARAMSLPHALVVCAVHRVAHHGDAGDLLWIWDIHLLASALSTDALHEMLWLAEARRVSAVCARALNLAAWCFGTALPADIRAWCDREQAHARRERLEPYLSGERRLADRLWRDIRALPSWRDRLRLIGQHGFPAPAYMRGRYGERPLLPWLYLRRLTMGIPRWISRR